MKIKLHPTGQELPGDPNKSILQICFENKVEMKSLCKGVPSCAECRVRVLSGENNLIPPTKAELNLIGTSYYLDGRRLACQLRAFGDVVIDISEHLERDDNSSKKVRGFRGLPGKTIESKAVQGTLILEESQERPSSPGSVPGSVSVGTQSNGGGGNGNNNGTSQGSNNRNRNLNKR